MSTPKNPNPNPHAVVLGTSGARKRWPLRRHVHLDRYSDEAAAKIRLIVDEEERAGRVGSKRAATRAAP